MPERFAAVMKAINGFNRIFGQIFSWLSLAMVLVCFAVVVERYLFSSTRLWMQDLYVWLNGAMFTAVAAFALYRNEHVRVDIFYRPAPPRRKAVADLIGVFVFLMPFLYVTYSVALPFVARSWTLFEGSANVGGMPGLFVLKTFLLVFTVTMALQGVSMVIRSILVLRGREDLIPDDYAYDRGTQSAAAPPANTNS